MLRTRVPEVGLCETVLPDEVRRLSEELAESTSCWAVRSSSPYLSFFDQRGARPRMEVYLRLIFLRFRYRQGYDSLCREVVDSITRGGSAGSPLDGPHAPPTLPRATDSSGGRGQSLDRL